MTRKKVKLAYITNDSARKATYKKRKKGLMKKVSELSTLCGVDACAIIYSSYDPQPEIWPSPSGAQRVLTKFKNMPEMEQSKKMVNQDSFLRQRISKANEQLKKQQRDNRKKEMTQVMFQALVGNSLNNLNMLDLNDLEWLINQNLNEVQNKIDSLKKEANSSASVAVAGPSGEVKDIAPQQEAEKQASEMNMEAMQKQPWITDWINQQQENMGFLGDDVNVPFWDNNNYNGLWSGPFFP